MSGPSWLVDSKRIARKIKSASESCDPRAVMWKSNPTRTCPKCNNVIDNSDVSHEWPGLPRGVKFDPSDQELLWHLLAKVGKGAGEPHPFIDEFIPTLEGDDGICYTHPQKLPGVKQDGSVSHFFHQTFKAYSTGTRKRRKINSGDSGDVRWHKTGKTKPVVIDGIHQGCKKIMVLYVSMAKGGKPEKTNWVMHQYHLGTGEDEKDGEYVVSKVFYQQQCKQNDKIELDQPLETTDTNDREDETAVALKSVTPEPPTEKRNHNLGSEMTPAKVIVLDESEIKDDKNIDNGEKLDDHDNHSVEDTKWWEGESQFLLDSQQLAEGIAICEEFLQSQTSCGGGEAGQSKPSLSDYAHMGVEHLKKDLEECQMLIDTDHPDIELDSQEMRQCQKLIDIDTPDNELDTQEMRLSQLEFGSQDSFLAWGGAKLS